MKRKASRCLRCQDILIEMIEFFELEQFEIEEMLTKNSEKNLKFEEKHHRNSEKKLKK